MLRDILIRAAVLSAAEAVVINTFAPQLRPVGGIGRLLERFFFVNIVLYYLYKSLIRPYFVSPLRKLPTVRTGNFVLGQGLKQMLDKPPGNALRELLDSTPNEGLIRIPQFLGGEALVATNQTILKAVVSDNTYDYEKPSQLAGVLRSVLGNGLILSEGSPHKFQRKHLLPSFQVSVIRDLYPTFWEKAAELAQDLRAESKKDEFEFGVWCTRVTLDIIGIAGFGRDFNSLRDPDDPFVQDYQELLEPVPQKALWFLVGITFGANIALNIPFWQVPKDLKRISKNLYEFAFKMTYERRAELKEAKGSADAKKDILSLLVKSNDFTDTELAHQCLTMMAAGHETTSNTLGWCVYLLAQHPDLQDQLREEIRSTLPSPDNISSESITAQVVDAMPLLNAVCNETLRLYPVVPITVRQAVKETQLAQYPIAKGQLIIISPWAINRSKGIWGPDANDFIPGRWINDDGKPNNTGGVSNNYSIMTFLHGPRSCIGQGFAKSEFKCLVAAVMGRYRVSITREESTYFPAGIVTTKAANGMWLKFDEVPGW